jgi:hypothetical protein
MTSAAENRNARHSSTSPRHQEYPALQARPARARPPLSTPTKHLALSIGNCGHPERRSPSDGGHLFSSSSSAATVTIYTAMEPVDRGRLKRSTTASRDHGVYCSARSRSDWAPHESRWSLLRLHGWWSLSDSSRAIELATMARR